VPLRRRASMRGQTHYANRSARCATVVARPRLIRSANSWAWVTRGFISVQSVGFGLPLFFALMIEMVSAFGPLGIVSYAEATREKQGLTCRDASRRSAAHPATS